MTPPPIAPAWLVRAAHRLTPTVDVEVDVLTVRAAATASTRDDWFGGGVSRVNVVVGDDGVLTLAEAGSRTLFRCGPESTPGATGASVGATQMYRTLRPTGPERLWIDCWPDPARVGVQGFTLHSIDLVVRSARFAQISFAQWTADWRREVLADELRLDLEGSGDYSNTPRVVRILLRDRDRRVRVTAGQLRTRTGSGRAADGTERALDVVFEGDLKISRLDVRQGFSIGVQVVERTSGFAWSLSDSNAALGMYPSNGGGDGARVAFDPATFWRVAPNRNTGPYPPGVGASGVDPSRNPGDGRLSSGAVPGFGARATQALDGGSQPYGQWGTAREVMIGNNYPGTQSGEPGWLAPYHVVRAVTFEPTGTVTRVFDLGQDPAAAGDEVHLRLDAAEPAGTSVTASLRGSANGVTWTALGAAADGRVLTGSERFRFYEVAATLTASPDGLVTPTLVAVQLTQRARVATWAHQGEDGVDTTVTIDPVTAQSEIGELRLPLLRLGRGRGVELGADLASRLASDAPVSQVEAWVYAADRKTGQRALLNTFRLEDRTPDTHTEAFVFTSGLDRLKVVVPPKVPGWQYPADSGTVASVAGVSFNSTTRECTLSFSGTPFAAQNVGGYRLTWRSGVLAGTSWRITTTPAPTNSACTIVLGITDPVPSAGDTLQIFSDRTTRAVVQYAGQDFAAIYADVLANQAAVPARYRGPLPPTTGRVGTGRLPTDGQPALEVLQALALHCGGAPAWVRGQVAFVDVYGPKSVAAVWRPQDLAEPPRTPTGYDRRMPSLGLKYGYDPLGGSFANEVTLTDAAALAALGRANLFDVTQVSDQVCRWNDYAECVWLGTTLLNAWATGVRLWRVRTTCPWPWLDLGHAVSVQTDGYTDRRPDGEDPLAGTPIRGWVSAVGVIVGKNLLGTEWVLAIRGLDAITPLAGAPVVTDGTVETPPPPADGAPGDTFVPWYRRSATAPATPSGDAPVGWSPTVPAGSDPVWESQARFTVAGVLAAGATWSTPIRKSGVDGAPGASPIGINSQLLAVNVGTQTVTITFGVDVAAAGATVSCVLEVVDQGFGLPFGYAGPYSLGAITSGHTWTPPFALEAAPGAPQPVTGLLRAVLTATVAGVPLAPAIANVAIYYDNSGV